MQRVDLIDTLWNVKSDEFFGAEKKMEDLIDTLWNVKNARCSSAVSAIWI